MKEVTDFLANAKDVMGKDMYYWALPWAPEGDQPGCDGVHWHIRALH